MQRIASHMTQGFTRGLAETTNQIIDELETGRLSENRLSKDYTVKRQQMLLSAVSGLRPANIANPAVHPNPPTVTFTQTGSTTIGGTPQEIRPTAEQTTTMLGIVPKWNDGLYMESYSHSRGSYAPSNDITANVVEYFWRAATGAGFYWVWVDDQPCTLEPVAWAAGANATCRLLVTFPGVESHRITVYSDLLQLKSIRVAAGHSVSAAPRPPLKFMGIGDSLLEGSGVAIPQRTCLTYTGRLLGWEYVMEALGGMGYVNGAKQFTHTDRLTAQADTSIDFYHFKGSVNDDPQTPSSIQAAAELCFENIYTNNPNAVILVSGPDPMASVPALGAQVRANSDAVRAAAMAWSEYNVIGWIDPLMTKNAIPWVSGAAYAVGARVTYQGGVYKCLKATTTTGFNNVDFGRISPLYGTGNTVTATNNGNRDQFCIADGHWSAAGHRYFGQYYAQHYLSALESFARGEFYIHE